MKKKLAGLVLLIGALLLGARLLRLNERLVKVEIAYELGDPPAADRLEAVIVPREGGSAPLAEYEAMDTRPVMTQKLSLPPGLYRVDVTLVAAGRTRRVTRDIDVGRGARIELDLRQGGRQQEE